MSGYFPPIQETNIGRIVTAIRDLYQGRSNATGQFTCALNVATTTVDAVNCGEQSEVFLSPRHVNAAAEVGNGTIYVSAVAAGSFTVTHANSATTNRTFGYAIKG